MRVLMVSAEAYPLASTGGLAGVVGALPGALERAGHRAAVVMPFYGGMEPPEGYRWLSGGLATSAGEQFGIAETRLPGSDCPVYLVSRSPLFDRRGLYGPSPDEAWPDNALRFAFLCRAAVTVLREVFETDVVHCHDWHSGLVPAYLRDTQVPTVTTVHNLAFQGRFPRSDYPAAGLPDSLYTPEGVEFWESWSFLKAGIVYSDVVTTVSPTYAAEIQTPGMGHGLDGVLRSRADSLVGILNGIDFRDRDPADDPAIPCSFSAGAVGGRRRCAAALRREMGISADPALLAGVVSRLTGQKGVDLLLDAAGELVSRGVGLAVLGTGEERLEEGLRELGRRFEGMVGVRIDYDDGLARRIFAGSDVFLMPSRFEPCGLGQMMAMRYGSVPVVRSTGGLADTVEDVSGGSRGTGFTFEAATAPALEKAVLRALRERRTRRWPWLVKRCMAADSSWDARVGDYVEVYRRAAEERGGRSGE
jgi:starch synthase